jgi:glycine cleavage system H protein
MADSDHMHAPAKVDVIRYKRSRFTTRLPVGYRYTASHMWLSNSGRDEWRVGYTKFAVRMLGEVVESGFEIKPAEPMKFGQIIGWLEGFKASTDLYSVMAGEFIGGNPTLGVQADRVHADPYGEGWLYHARGMPDPDALDVQGYIQVLDRAIDKIQGDDGSHE